MALNCFVPRYLIRTPYNGVLASQTWHDYCPQSSMIRGSDVT
ncbi:formate transporter, partial [Salmonella enterica subsp. enterica serovar Muenchen]|nr:formate transporter [Salmonella enterica subsp. enterica serovar Muenchen]